jgi:hypothetical protein
MQQNQYPGFGLDQLVITIQQLLLWIQAVVVELVFHGQGVF